MPVVGDLIMMSVRCRPTTWSTSVCSWPTFAFDVDADADVCDVPDAVCPAAEFDALQPTTSLYNYLSLYLRL